MLGERLCLLRRRMGWSQAELARRVNVSPSAVGMYEQGRREPSLALTVALSRVLEVSADYLLTGKPLTEQDGAAMQAALRIGLAGLEQGRGGLSREELTVLLAAALN